MPPDTFSRTPPPPRIAEAVRRTLAGENPLNEKVAMRLLTSLMNGKTGEEEATERRGRLAAAPATGAPLGEGGQSQLANDTLTPREAEVLTLVAKGQTNQQIARTLAISPSTVKRHIRRVSAKLGVRDRVQAAVRTVELGLLDERSGG